MPSFEPDSSFDTVEFVAGRGQQQGAEDEVAEALMPAVEPGVATVYRDHLGRKPETLTLPMLVADEATRRALRALIGYPGYALVTPQGNWTAELNKLSSGDRFSDAPIQCTGEFTLLAEEALPPPVDTTPPPVCGFVWAATGLVVELDFNQGGTWSADGSIDQVFVEFGDTGTATMTGPFGLSGIPSAFHTYSGAGSYVVNASVVRNGVPSATTSQLVTVS